MVDVIEESSDLGEPKPLLEGRGLTKVFGGVRAVNHVDVSVGENQIVGLIGPNGAGKTTLFDMLSGFGRPTEGSVLWQGQDITRLQPAARVKLGLIRSFQQSRVFPELTVHENLQIAGHVSVRGGLFVDVFRPLKSRANDRLIEERVSRIVETFGIGDLLALRGDELSYGVAKRLSLVMTLVADPKMVLLDEPAAGLNGDEIDLLQVDLIRLRTEGVAVLFVEHHMELVMDVSDRLTVLDAGSIIAEGTPDAVASDPVVIEAYLGVSS